MNRAKQIINKTLSIIGVLFLAGCETSKPDWGKYRGVSAHPHIDNERITLQQLNTHSEQIEAEAAHLDMSVVSYLHAVNNDKIRRPAISTINPVEYYSSSNTTSYNPIVAPLYQAYDPQYPDLPQISPVFVTRADARAYADSNNSSGGTPTGHKYIVREVNYRYEVRHQNDDVNDVIFTSYRLNDSEKYLNTYKANHTDLVIFDLMDSVVVGVNTP